MRYLAAALCFFGWIATSAYAADEPIPDFVAGKLIVFNDNGAWCWYQDERVIVDPAVGKMIIGFVPNKAGKNGEVRHGNIEVMEYGLSDGKIGEPFILHEKLEADDHDTPALIIRPDGRYLAVYTRHNSDKVTRWRISKKPHDATEWEEEKTFDWSQPPASIGDNKATYSNVFYLPAEKKTYDFVRSVNRDPSALVSSDDGSTFSFGGKLLTDTNVGYVNGYVKYASNGKDRIDFITTEHHPRDFNNSIWHGYVKGGKTYKADGAVVDEDLFDVGKAPKPADLTSVFKAGTVVDGEPMTHCWTTDLTIGKDGNPVALLTCRANDTPENSNFNDHRFFYARYDGNKWDVHQLAKGGARLWAAEQDYIGGGAIDPQHPEAVYISAPIDPRDNSKLAKHEIFKGTTSDGGATWAWKPITYNSTQSNLRPIVPQWQSDRTALLWLRGSMSRSQDYNMQVVGTIEPRQ
jgi:hypothetical protein